MNRFNKFSVPLGLLDYINPIFYGITIITIINNIFIKLNPPYNIMLILGAIISITFGFIIPTGKVLVGLKIIKFKMPVSLVFFVNTGILLSGIALLKYIYVLNIIIIALTITTLILIYIKTKKTNTIAVLTGTFGYIYIYTSLIAISLRQDNIIPVVLYSFAILLFIMLCVIGIKANLKNPKVHWLIEVSNVLCQFLVATGTLILFK